MAVPGTDSREPTAAHGQRLPHNAAARPCGLGADGLIGRPAHTDSKVQMSNADWRLQQPEHRTCNRICKRRLRLYRRRFELATSCSQSGRDAQSLPVRREEWWARRKSIEPALGLRRPCLSPTDTSGCRGSASRHREREVEGRTQGGRCEVQELVRRYRDDHAAELRRYRGDTGARLSLGEGLPVWRAKSQDRQVCPEDG